MLEVTWRAWRRRRRTSGFLKLMNARVSRMTMTMMMRAIQREGEEEEVKTSAKPIKPEVEDKTVH